MPQKRDVVYILKADIDPYELRYSLRSVEKNFPFRKVWFVCGQPKGFEPDGRIVHKQTGDTKWEKARSSLLKVCASKEITEDFYLFNDDFFVMKPFKGEFINYTAGTLDRRLAELAENRSAASPYMRQLERTRNELKIEGFDTISFCVHLPMLINKKKCIEVLKTLESPMFRSQYGNRARIPYIYHADVKIYDVNTVPDEDCDYLSTIENIFREGKAGEFIRNRFPEPSRFEV